MDPVYKLTARGRQKLMEGIPHTTMTIASICLLMVLLCPDSGGRPSNLKLLREGAHFVMMFQSRTPWHRHAALFLRDHTRAVVAGALARGWIVAQQSA